MVTNLDINNLKEWSKIDDDDKVLKLLIGPSKTIIRQATGITKEEIENNKEALELYELIQMIIITDLHENRSGTNSITSPTMISLLSQLRTSKN